MTARREKRGERWADEVIEALEAIAADRALLAELDPETRTRLLRAAGVVSRPDRAAMRTLAKAFRRR